MSVELRTPIELSTATKGAKGWRKQVLPLGSITYYGRKLDFTPDYLHDVARAFNDRAFDTVPLVLADEKNNHTMSAERGKFGEVIDMSVDLDAVDPDTGKPAPGLYSTIRLSEEAEEIVQANPRFGVSVRIKEDYLRPDGKRWRAACQHVLGTWDPRVTGMSGWQSVDLSNDQPGGALIDLSGLTYRTEEEAPMADNDTIPETPPAWFTAMVENGQITLGPAGDADGEGWGELDDATDTDTDVDDDGLGELTDEEFAAWLEAEGVGEETPDLVEASHGADYGDIVDLAYHDDERVRTLELSNATLQAKVAAADFERERAELVTTTGLPPDVIDLARPLLEGDRVVSLSNGDDVDAGDVMRQVLGRIGEMVNVLDLSAELGQLAPPTGAQEEQEKTRNTAKAFLAQAGLS